MENRLSREAARARQHWRMSWVAAATTLAIICRLVQLQRGGSKGKRGSENREKKRSVGRQRGGRRGWEEGDLLGQQYHPDVSHGTYCQQTSNITH